MRPGLVDFLNYCFSRFDNVILWSAGDDYYVKQVVECIFKKTDNMPNNVLARSNCHIISGEVKKKKDAGSQEVEIYTKPLSKLEKIDPSMTLQKCIFVDDNPDNSYFNISNHVLIPRFEPKCNATDIDKALDNDRALYDLIEWLESDQVKYCKDIRELPKTGIFH